MLERAWAQEPLYEVALLDHDMPECDGAELGRRIYEDSRFKAMRLVLLTSSGMRGDSPRFAQLGFAGICSSRWANVIWWIACWS